MSFGNDSAVSSEAKKKVELYLAWKKGNDFMQTKVISLKRNHSRFFVADDKFWSNVQYMTFHSAHLEIKLKRGRSTNYLHDWFFNDLEEFGNSHTEQEKQAIYEKHSCAYRFPKQNDEFLSYLYDEAKERGLLEYPKYLVEF